MAAYVALKSVQYLSVSAAAADVLITHDAMGSNSFSLQSQRLACELCTPPPPKNKVVNHFHNMVLSLTMSDKPLLILTKKG